MCMRSAKACIFIGEQDGEEPSGNDESYDPFSGDGRDGAASYVPVAGIHSMAEGF